MVFETIAAINFVVRASQLYKVGASNHLSSIHVRVYFSWR